jgi:aromatic-L-amino-acid/L-tryptophan decarboxylase
METTLDPSDWESLRRLGHRMVDDMLEYLRSVRDRPVWGPVPESVRRQLGMPLPDDPTTPEHVYADFREQVLPYALGNTHPRFWGLVCGTGTPFGMLAELLAGGLNANVFAGEHSAPYVEAQVIGWLERMLGIDETASGVLVSGGSVANLVGLTVARNVRSGIDLDGHGLANASQRPVLYGSTETHNSVAKAVQTLGLGRRALRLVPTNARYEIDVSALERAINDDRAAGYRPFCIVANAGTVNTGATDDMLALADIAAANDLWMHVDGAFGALVALSPKLRSRVAGLERADSVAFDLHKWLHMPYEVACVLVRDREAHRAAFSPSGAYLGRMPRGLMSGPYVPNEYGPELSRGFRALKVWMSLKEHGRRRFSDLIEQNVAQAAYLADRIAATPGLELAAPVPLNIVCFRATAPGVDVNELNREILMRLQERGIAVPTGTVLNGCFVIRVAITNHRSRREDFDALVDAVAALRAELVIPDPRRGSA